MKHLFAAALLVVSGVAHADAVPGPPENCPVGSNGQTSHAGTWCEASTCDADDECGTGESCRSVGLCVDVQEWECGGMRPDTGDGCTFTVNEALGRCSTDGDCARGTCITADRCARAGVLSSCRGCSSAHPNRAALLGGLLLLGLVGVRDRRIRG